MYKTIILKNLPKYTLDELRVIKMESNVRDPNLVCHQRDFESVLIQELFPECKLYQIFTREKTCTRVRIIAGYSKVAAFDGINPLDNRIQLKVGSEDVFSLSRKQQLPLLTLLKMSRNTGAKYLNIEFGNKTYDEKLPNLEEFFLELNIDTNNIFSIRFVDLHKQEIRVAKEADVKSHSKHQIPLKPIEYDTRINAVGMDVGTSRCCIAVSRKNGIETVAAENTGERLLPSFVAYDEENEKCGQIVVSRLRNKSSSTVFDVKRLIGKKMEYIIINPSWPYDVIEEDGEVLISIEGHNGPLKKTPEEVTSVLIKKMKKEAEKFQGQELTDVVVTIPAAFTEKQKNATIKAAKLAGWKTVFTIIEPLAAAFAYYNSQKIPNDSNILVFDLGGGTLDVCLFKIIDKDLHVISKNGDTYLGGRDFDNLLINYITGILEKQYKLKINDKLKYRLMKECMDIKHNLTIREKEELDLDELDTSLDGTIEITRKKFEEMSIELLLKIKTVIIKALTDVNYISTQVDKVLQVGGACRMPMIKKILEDMFPYAHHCCEEHPDEVVAVGAAFFAYNLFSNNDEEEKDESKNTTIKPT